MFIQCFTIIEYYSKQKYRWKFKRLFIFLIHDLHHQAILIVILDQPKSFCLGKTGHRIVGRIAENYLTKNAKHHLKKLMGHHDLSRMSNWADEIKSDSYWYICK